MQYGQLITRSLAIVWRHPYLWVLAILGGADVGAGGFSGNFNTGTRSIGGRGANTEQITRFLQDHLGQILVLLAILGVLALAWFLLSCVTTGALIRGSAEHDAERPFGAGPAWRAGLRSFGSILVLRLFLFALVVLIVGIAALFVGLAVASFSSGRNGTGAVVVILGVLLALALVVAAIPFGIALILATRAIVLEERGPIDALRRGLGLLSGRLGRVLLVWLIQVGLGAAASLTLAIPVLVLSGLLVAALVGAGIAGGGGGLAAAIPLAILVGIVILCLVLVVGALVGAYQSTYWTLAFRRLELEQPGYAAPWPPRAGDVGAG
jgi:hypothetical protein